MRILFLHSTWESASEYNVHRLLAEHADPQRVNSFFIWQSNTRESARNVAPKLAHPEQTFFWDFGRDMGITPKPPCPVRARMMFQRLPASLLMLSSKIRTLKPDMLYTSQQFYEVFLARYLAAIFRLPHVIHISYPVGPWLGQHAYRSILRSRYLIACSEFIRKGALAAGVAPAHIKTLLHGADLQQYDIPGERAQLRAEFNWSEQTPVVLVAARLDPHKGYIQLLDAFALVHRQMPQVRLLSCGNSTYGDGYDLVIKRHAEKLGLGDAVTFAGFRTDLPYLMAAADLFCLPTENDALPLVFLAAMAAGLPVAAVRSGGVPEMVLENETGLLSEVGDSKALAANMMRILRDPALAAQLGTAGKYHAFENFSPQRIAGQWVEILYSHVYNTRGTGQAMLAGTSR